MITARPATGADRFIVRRWLDDPALPSWWGPRDSVEATITYAQEVAKPLLQILEREGEPIGIALAFDVAFWSDDLPHTIERGTWVVCVFISRSSDRVADTAEALARVTNTVFETQLALGCCGFVSIRNEAAARAFEKAGFTWSEIWHDGYAGPCWVMVRPRPLLN